MKLTAWMFVPASYAFVLTILGLTGAGLAYWVISLLVLTIFWLLALIVWIVEGFQIR